MADRQTWRQVRIPALTVAGCVRAANFGFVATTAPYLAERGLEADEIGFVVAAAGITTAASQAVWGRALERWSTRPVGVVAGLLATAGSVFFALVTAPLLLILADVVLSAGFAGLMTTVRTSVSRAVAEDGEGAAGSDTQEARFGQLTGAQTIGGLVGPLALGVLVIGTLAVAPWFAAAVMLAATLVWAFVTGMPPVPPSGEEPAEPGDRAATPSRPSLPAVTRSLAVPLLCLTGFSALYGANAVLWGLYLQGIGAPASWITWSFAIFSIPMVFVAPRAGRIWGSVPRGVATALGTAGLGLSALVYGFVTNVPLAVALTVVEGTLMALTTPVLWAQVAVRLEEAAQARGFALMGGVDATVSVVATSVAGIVIATASAQAAWFVFGAVCTACATAGGLVAARETRRRPAAAGVPRGTPTVAVTD